MRMLAIETGVAKSQGINFKYNNELQSMSIMRKN